MQQQQIQALLANVEELTHQNEESRKTMESQNAERQRMGENQNEEELNSQANMRDRTSGKGSRWGEFGWDDSKDGLTIQH